MPTKLTTISTYQLVGATAMQAQESAATDPWKHVTIHFLSYIAFFLSD